MPMAAFRSRRLAPATISARRCERSASVIPGREQSERARNLEVPGSIFELGFTRVRRIWLSKSATADLDAHRPGTRPSRIAWRVGLAEDVDGIAGHKIRLPERRIGIQRKIGDRQRADGVKGPDRKIFHQRFLYHALAKGQRMIQCVRLKRDRDEMVERDQTYQKHNSEAEAPADQLLLDRQQRLGRVHGSNVVLNIRLRHGINLLTSACERRLEAAEE